MRYAWQRPRPIAPTEAAAEANARAQTVARQLGEAEQRWRRLDQQFAQVRDGARSDRAQAGRSRRHSRPQARNRPPPKAFWGRRATPLVAAEQARAATGPALAAARERQTAADSAHAKLAAEAHALAEVLAVKDGERWPPMVDALSVPAGLETALGAALGEELTSAADPLRRGIGGSCHRSTPRPSCRAARRRWQRWSRDRRPWRARCRRSGWSKTSAIGEGGAGRSGTRPGAGLARRRGLALGWLYDPRRHADRGRRPAATAQPAVRCCSATWPRRASRSRRSARARASRPKPTQAAMAAEQPGPRGSARAPSRPWSGTRGTHEQLRAHAAEIAARLAGIDDADRASDRPNATRPAPPSPSPREAHAALPDLAALRGAVDAARAALSAARSRETPQHAPNARRWPMSMRPGPRRATRSRRSAPTGRSAPRDAAAGWPNWRRGGERPRPSMRPCKRHRAQIAARRAEALDALEAAEATHRARGRQPGGRGRPSSGAGSRRARRGGCARRGARGRGARRGRRGPGRAGLERDGGTHHRTAGRQPGPARPAGRAFAGDRRRRRAAASNGC